MHIGILQDSNSSYNHFDSTVEIANFESDILSSLKRAIKKLRHSVFLIDTGSNLKSILCEENPDFVINLSNKNSMDGYKAYGPSVLEDLEIPFTGSSSLVCANAYNKEKMKVIFKNNHIRTPKHMVINLMQTNVNTGDLEFPLFLKPVYGGCSRGIEKDNLIRNRLTFLEKINNFDSKNKEPYLLEEFINGREFTVGVIGNTKIKILPILELILPGNYKNLSFRDYSSKMINYEEEENICPAKITKKLQHDIEQIAEKTYRAMGCRDYARVDIRIGENNKPFVLEINALPSLAPENSSFALMAKANGMSFTQLIKVLLNHAKNRYIL